MKNNEHGKSFSLRSVTHFFLRHFTLAILATVFLSGCGSGGGGGGGGSSTASGANVLSGTAATGAPIASGTVTLKDSTGATVTTTTDPNGNYSFNVSGSTAPFILKAVPKAGGSVPLYSFSNKSGTTNITPLTDLVLFEALGRSDIGTVFDSGDLSKLTVSAVSSTEKMVRDNFSNQLTTNGLNPITIDLLHTPFNANKVGLDAVIDNALVEKLGTDVFISDSGGLCVGYGRNVSGVTFAINGMHPNFLLYFLGLETPPPLSGPDLLDEYVKTALDKACISGQIIDFHWTREPKPDDTLVAVALLKKKLRDANKAETINIVAHSWGSVIAYIALTELADPVEKVPGDKLIKVDNLITMGSPIQYLAENPNNPTTLIHIPNWLISQIATDLEFTKTILANMQASVPGNVRYPNSIQWPDNIRSWVNFQNFSDPIATTIAPLGDKNNIPVVGCPSSSSIVCQHNVYFDTGVASSVAPTLFKVREIISKTQTASSPVPPVQPPTVPETLAPPPGAFTVTAGAPYCDTSAPAGPAVKLAWSTSTNAIYYRVFRDNYATGVQLDSSQFDFVNNLGLVAGQTYSYKIMAINAGGSTWSDLVQVTIPASVCGSVTDPKITVGPATLNFGNVAVGSCGAATFAVQHVIGTNPASGTVSVGPYPPFSIISGGSFSVSNGSAANVSVQFCPSSPLTYTGTATVTSSATFTGANTVTLSGTGTSTPTCTVSFNGSSSSIDASGGQRQIILTTSGSSCTWSATSNQAWAHNITPSNGTAGATLTYTVDPNNSTQSRSATIMAGQATLTVSQLGNSASCTFSLGETTKSVPANGGTFLVGLLASNQSCARTAQSNATFITNVSPAIGNGDANISYTVAPNTSASPRSGTLTIAGQTLTVNQDGLVLPTPTTPTSLSPGSISSPGPTLGSSTVTVSWNASSGATLYIGGITDIAAGIDVVTINTSGMSTTATLSPGKQYRWYIDACNSSGCSSISALYYFQTPKVVTVANTGGIGLNLRSTASTSGTVIAALPDGTTMNVIGGPTLANGFTWWNISGTYGTGWSAIAEWLTPAPQIGATVTVSYTGGAGLRLRNTASISGTVITTLPEGAQMTVFGGPIQANGYTWWAIQGVVSGTSYTGWSAVGDWLTPNPRY